MRVLTADGSLAKVRPRAGFLDGGDDGRWGPSVSLVPGPDGVTITRDYESIYKTNPWLSATVRMLSNGAARMPIHVFRFTDDEHGRERIRPRGAATMDPKLRRARSLAAALYRPGHGTSAAALKRGTMVNAKTRGKAVWIIERDRVGDYVGFKRIPARYVGCEKRAGVLVYWDIREPGTTHISDDVIHFGRSSDCDEYYTPSPIDALHSTIALYDAVQRHLVAFMKNSARPSGHYQVQPGTGKAARRKIAETIRELYTSPENAGRVLVTSAKWESHGQPVDHSRYIELAKASREEIVAEYNMPPPMVGILDRAIMSNVREMRSLYARDVVGPDLVLWEGDIDAQLVAQDDLLAEDVYLEFQLAAVMRPDLEARAQLYRDRLEVESLNEVRATENLPKVDHPDADLPRMPANQAPIGQPPTAGFRQDESTDLWLPARQENDR